MVDFQYKRFVKYFPLMLCGIMVFVLLFSLNSTEVSSQSHSSVGKKIPQFRITALSDATRQFSDVNLQQGENIILNVWASWCGPCRVEHPILLNMAKDGILIYGLNYRDRRGAAQRFLKKHGNPFEYVGFDNRGLVGIELGIYGVPETFVISGEGKILARQAGVLTKDFVLNHIYPFFPNANQGLQR